MTCLCAAYVLVLGKIGQVSALPWGYGMLTCPCPGAHCHPPMGKIKQYTSPKSKIMNMIGKIINTLKDLSDQKRKKIQRLDFIHAGQSNGLKN